VIDGLVLIGLGVAILAIAPGVLRNSLYIEPRLLRLNFPKLARRYPKLPVISSYIGVAFGLLVGLMGIGGGIVLLLRG
jgi:hypothetical protein